jgi:hypothetical protein
MLLEAIKLSEQKEIIIKKSAASRTVIEVKHANMPVKVIEKKGGE